MEKLSKNHHIFTKVHGKMMSYMDYVRSSFCFWWRCWLEVYTFVNVERQEFECYNGKKHGKMTVFSCYALIRFLFYWIFPPKAYYTTSATIGIQKNIHLCLSRPNILPSLSWLTKTGNPEICNTTLHIINTSQPSQWASILQSTKPVNQNLKSYFAFLQEIQT